MKQSSSNAREWPCNDVMDEYVGISVYVGKKLSKYYCHLFQRLQLPHNSERRFPGPNNRQGPLSVSYSTNSFAERAQKKRRLFEALHGSCVARG